VLLLAFDTATPAISAALHDGDRVIAAARHEGSMAHGEQLMPTVTEVLAAAGAAIGDVTDIAVGVGPGPFTGLRVGVVTALTLAHSLNAVTHGVCSLDPIAFATTGASGDFIVATDARRHEVYWARYGADGVRIAGPHVDLPDVVANLGLPVVGRGGAVYGLDTHGLSAPIDPHADDLATLVASGRAVTLPLEPLYLRRPDAKPLATVPTL
jgi:tRNA threonylcarbamoyl adenosine modification protein YeaZ